MNQQPQMNMAGMAGGPVGGGPQMQPMNAGTPTNGMSQDPNMMIKLNTAIYDYLLRTEKYSVARELLKSAPEIETKDPKQSPNQRPGMQPNGIDDDYDMSAFASKPEDLPLAQTINDGPFLQDWWGQFWDILRSHRGKPGNAQSYVTMQRARGPNGMNQAGGPAGMRNFNAMVGPNGMIMNTDLKRAAMQNNRNMTPQQLAQMQNMKAATQNGQLMQANQMERSGSNMDNRSGSPGSGDAPSPKRQRIDGGGMQMAQGRPGQPGQMQQGQPGLAPNMGPGGAQGSPMSQPGMDGANGEFYAATNGGNRMPMQGQAAAAAAAAGAQGSNGNHALQDYQMQLMLLEQQNKKRLLMARQEQDSMSSGSQPHPGGVGPAGNFAPGSPSAGQMMDPNNIPPNMRQMVMGANGQVMRPQGPSSHPGLTPQMEMMRANGMPMPTGQFPPGQQPPGMMPGQQPGQPGPQGTPRQANTNMPPPPAPPAGTGPSSPSQQPAPPTPSTTNKPKGGNKKEAAKKGAAAKKGGAAAATTNSEAEPPTPTPATPITPMNPKSFNPHAPGLANGAPPGPPGQQGPPQQPPQQPDDVQEPFGSLDQFGMNLDFDLTNSGDVLDNFDFESFLNTDGDNGLSGFDANFAFGDGIGSGIEGAN